MENVSQVPDSQLHVFQAALSKQEQDQSFRGKYSIEGALLPNADLEVHSDVPVLRRVKLDISNDRNRSTRTPWDPACNILQHMKQHTKKNIRSAKAPPDKASQSLLDQNLRFFKCAVSLESVHFLSNELI